MEASSRGAKGENMRARMRFVTTGAVVAFAAAMVLSGSGPAIATNNQPILAANGNSETFGTTVYNTGTSDPCGTDPTFVGLKGCGSTGLAGNGFIGVFGSGTGWPDYIVAAIMSGLALVSSVQVARQAFAELREPQAVRS